MSRFVRLITGCVIGLLVLAGMGSLAHAQVLYGSLTGNVTDPSSAAVPSAKVEILNVGTGVARQATTDERGVDLFTNLQPGTYKVTIAVSAFKTVVEDNVIVNANEVRRVDRALQISQTTETVEVSASVNILQTDKADVHQDLTSQEVTQLPYSGGE